MPYFRITLLRSGIGLPKRTNDILTSMGLRKRMRTVFLPVTPDIAGKIMKVKELVAVSEVEESMTKRQIHEMRKPVPGFWVERAVSRDGS